MRAQATAPYDDDDGGVSLPEGDADVHFLSSLDQDHVDPLLLEDGEDVGALLSWAGALF